MKMSSNKIDAMFYQTMTGARRKISEPDDEGHSFTETFLARYWRK